MTQRLGLPDQTAHYETTSCGRAPNAVLTPLARALPKLPFGWTRFLRRLSSIRFPPPRVPSPVLSSPPSFAVFAPFPFPSATTANRVVSMTPGTCTSNLAAGCRRRSCGRHLHRRLHRRRRRFCADV